MDAGGCQLLPGEIGHNIVLHQKLPCDCVGRQEMWFPVVSMKDADLLVFLKFRCSLVSSVCREAGNFPANYGLQQTSARGEQ